MSSTLIKICGITRLNDALNAVELGADMLGFVLYPKSKRYVSVEKVQEIVSELPNRVKKVAVVVNESVNVLEKYLGLGLFDYLQLSGDESPDECKHFGDKIIKVIHVENGAFKADPEHFSSIKHLLFDSSFGGNYGGTGRAFDWSILKDLSIDFGIAGGLTAENINGIITTLQPRFVDISSGVESAPGIKDQIRMIEFITACRNTEI